MSGGGRTELARLDPCLCTVSGFLGPPQTSVSYDYDASEVTLIFGSSNSNWIPVGIPGRSQMGKEGALPELTGNMFHYGCYLIYFQR